MSEFLLKNKIVFPYKRKIFAIPRRKIMIKGLIPKRRAFQFSCQVKTTLSYTMVHDAVKKKNHPKGPFEVSHNSGVSYLGRVPIQTHVRPPEAVGPPVSVYLQGIIGLLPRTLIDGDHQISRLHLATGSWYNVHETFRLFGQYYPQYNRNIQIDKRQMLVNVLPFIKNLKLPFVPYIPVWEDIFNVDINGKAHPGVLTRRAVQLNTGLSQHPFNKRECLEFVLPIFRKKYANILAGKHNTESGVYAVGGKEKIHVLDSEAEEFSHSGGETVWGHELSTRPVMIPEYVDILCDSLYASAFMNVFKIQGSPTSDIWVGHSLAHGGWEKVKVISDFAIFSFEGDASKFDRNTTESVILLCFGVVRGCFPKESSVDNAFCNMASRFINKILITPEGECFGWKKGVPSGNIWTSIIGSLYTWIIWYNSFIECPVFIDKYKSRNSSMANLSVVEWVETSIKFSCYGDDLRFGSIFDMSQKDIDNLCHWFLVNYNYKIRSDSVKGPGYDEDLEKNTSLLRTVINSDKLPDVKTWDLWEKIIFGAFIKNKRRNEVGYLIDRIRQLCVSDATLIESVAVRLTICDLLYTYKGDQKLLLFDMMKHHFVSKEFNIDAFCDMCSRLGISASEFWGKVKHFSSSVGRNYRNVFLQPNLSKISKEVWETGIGKIKMYEIEFGVFARFKCSIPPSGILLDEYLYTIFDP